MWNSICAQISDQLHIPFEIREKSPIEGVHHAALFRISDGSHDFFVKILEEHEYERFDAECQGLDTLTLESQFLVPGVVCQGKTLSHSYLVLDWLNFTPPDDNAWQQAGAFLARMHRKHDQQMFGAEEDNFIGKTVQPNRWHKRWDIFFSEERIGWQLQLLYEQGHRLCDIDAFVAQIKHALHPHFVEPSLVHGDLWRGNIGFVDGVPCVFDPACYYGDRETDIAMTELFGAFPEAFYTGYNQHYRLSPDYPSRRPIYQLYHVLNHANLFGGAYLSDATTRIEQLRQQLPKP